MITPLLFLGLHENFPHVEAPDTASFHYLREQSLACLARARAVGLDPVAPLYQRLNYHLDPHLHCSQMSCLFYSTHCSLSSTP
jgi:hypothetical protein